MIPFVSREGSPIQGIGPRASLLSPDAGAFCQSDGLARNQEGEHLRIDNPLLVWALTLPGTAVQSDDYSQTLDFILQCKDNDPVKAEQFLKQTLKLLQSSKQVEPNEDELVRAELDERESCTFQKFFNDEVDTKPTTLVLLVPGQAYIIGHLIGKSGAEISKIENSSDVTIRVDSKNKMPIGSLERRVYVLGSVANCVHTQQLITERIHEKLKEEGVKQELIKIAIPHEGVPHLIGKGGSSIKRLQELSGARIQVEQETSIVPGTVGRAVTIQGSRYQRSMAQYLISRQMVENRSTKKEWQGGVPQPFVQNYDFGSISSDLQTEELGVIPCQHLEYFPGLAVGLETETKGKPRNYSNPTIAGSGDSQYTSGPSYPCNMNKNTWFNSNNTQQQSDPLYQAACRSNDIHEQVHEQEQKFAREDLACSIPYSFETLVPDHSVGHIIGRSGSVITDIQRRSRAKISFTKNQADPSVQIVTILGSSQAIHHAHALISEKVVEHMRDRDPFQTL